jgi:putative nucleotidyltransferase with HDIG domain
MSEVKIYNNRRRSLYLVILLLVTMILAAVALMLPLINRLFSPSLQVGQVAPEDVLAPASITYESEVLTEQRRDAAERAVAPVYTRADTRVARQQLERLRSALAYITSVRADTYASDKQKQADLAALEDIHLSQEIANQILALSDSRWQVVQQEAIVVLEQVMRSTIRTDRLEDYRSGVPALVSLSLPEEQAAIVAELAAGFVAPNSLYSEDLTNAARQTARDAVDPVSQTFITGERVVQRGQVLTETDLEALRRFGLAQPQQNWQEPVSAAVLAILMAVFMVFFLRRQSQSTLSHDPRSLTLLAVLFLAFLFGARLTVPGHTVIPYAFPIATFGLIVAALFNAKLALFSSLPLAVMAAFGLPNQLDLSLYYIMGGLFGVLALGRARRMTAFFWAGGAIAVAGALVIIVYYVPEPTSDLVGVTTLIGTAVFNGLASASLAVVLQFFLAQILGMTTPMQLTELSRPDQPVLQSILREAPGTYQHSLQVANLAEQAAERIGADALLTRVGALYHDMGKAENPVFFIENQVPGHLNPHDDLDPLTSSAIIIRHVTDGLDMAKKYHLPRRISDFVREHHGTMLTRYQYVKAVEAAGGDESLVDMEAYRYPGPRPQSRETAILMLADGCEARVRAERPTEEDVLQNIVKSVIDTRIAIGELDDTDLTLRDLSRIQESFVATLRGIYHPRVQYPRLEKRAAESVPASADIPTLTRGGESQPVSRPASEAPLGNPVDNASATS